MTTIVTMYFNLKSLADSTEEVRPKSFYLDRGRVTLSLEAPMIIFCDDSCIEDIKLIRANRPTLYYSKPFTEYAFYTDNWPIIGKNREASKMYNNSRNTASYALLSLFKVYAIYLASMINPFKSTHFLWMDFGGSHVMRGVATHTEAILKTPHPKIAFCYIHYRSSAEIKPPSAFYNGGQCGIAAGCFSVEATYAAKLYTGCMGIFYQMIHERAFHAEEQVLTYFYDKYPDLCTLYYGDYYSLVTNYTGVREDFPSIKKYFIIQTINKGRKDLAKTCALKVLQSVEQKIIKISDADIVFLKSVAA
jgi:hypothetical protein